MSVSLNSRILLSNGRKIKIEDLSLSQGFVGTSPVPGLLPQPLSMESGGTGTGGLPDENGAIAITASGPQLTYVSPSYVGAGESELIYLGL